MMSQKKFFLKLFLIFGFIFSLPVRSQNYNNLSDYIDHFTDSVITQAGVPGLMVSVTKDGKILYEKAKGYANIDTKEKMDLKMRFRIGSLTKTFTITALLQLVDESLVKLDEPIKRFFPDITKSDIITVRMLCDMS